MFFSDFSGQVVKVCNVFFEVDNCQMYITIDPKSYIEELWVEAADDLLCTLKEFDPFACMKESY